MAKELKASRWVSRPGHASRPESTVINHLVKIKITCSNISSDPFSTLLFLYLSLSCSRRRLQCDFPSRRNFCLFCSLLFPQSQEQCLAHSRHSINIGWIDELTLIHHIPTTMLYLCSCPTPKSSLHTLSFFYYDQVDHGCISWLFYCCPNSFPSYWIHAQNSCPAAPAVGSGLWLSFNKWNMGRIDVAPSKAEL